MFRKKKDGKAKAGIEQIGNVPLTAYDRAKAEWAERNGDATVNQSRYFVLLVLMMLGVVLMAGALFGLAPLKTVIPYEISFDRNTGETNVRPITTERFVPNDTQKRYFIARWVRQLLTIDPFTTERDLTEAFSFVRGKAVGEFQDFIRTTQPIVRVGQDRNLTRAVQVSSLQFIGDNVAQTRVVTQERTTGQESPQKRFILTIHFVIEPPKTEREMYQNPIGLHITHFAISEELQ